MIKNHVTKCFVQILVNNINLINTCYHFCLITDICKILLKNEKSLYNVIKGKNAPFLSWQVSKRVMHTTLSCTAKIKVHVLKYNRYARDTQVATENKYFFTMNS